MPAGHQYMRPAACMTPTLREFHARHREQELVFQMARDLTRQYVRQPTCEAPAHVLFPQLVMQSSGAISRIRLIRNRLPNGSMLSSVPYYGWIIELLVRRIRPDTASGEAPEIPDIEQDRVCSTADIEVWTGKEVREALHTHVNLVVNDTVVWEQSAAYLLDTHPRRHRRSSRTSV